MPSSRATLTIHPGEPLWKRAPARDARGCPYGDFMMIIPGLRRLPSNAVKALVNDLNAVLAQWSHAVVFADLNLHLGVLWVTVPPRREIGLALAAAIHDRVPAAKLVAADLRYG